jgi:hypothetical protein
MACLFEGISLLIWAEEQPPGEGDLPDTPPQKRPLGQSGLFGERMIRF